MKRTSSDPPGREPPGWNYLLILGAVLGSSAVTLLLLWAFGLLEPVAGP